MNTIKTFIATIGIVSVSLLHAAEPVAIVEDVHASSTGLSFMDYLNEGQIIKLGKEERITIGYLSSCQREIITGGTVTVGKEQSKVNKGQILSEEVECSGGQAKLSGQQAGTSGALAFRGGPKHKPDVTIYGTAPVFRLHSADASITIEPVSRRGQTHTIEVKGHHVDLANKDISLSPGIYKAMAGDKSTIFKIHHSAEPGKAPIISRLVDL